MGADYSRRSSVTGGDSGMPRLMNNADPLQFHSVCGDNVVLSHNNTVASRFEGFCKGIAFSHRPVAVNEHIYIKFLDISSNWSGALRIGFTSNDPLTYKSKLPKYACPCMTDITGNWARALGERMAKADSVLFYFVDQNGDVHYGLNGENKGIFLSGVNTSGKLWAMLDIYGNTVGVEFLDPRSRRQSQSSESLCHPDAVMRNRACVPLTTQLGISLTPMLFHQLHGNNVKLQANRTKLVRIPKANPDSSCCGYAFTERPLKNEECLVFQVMVLERPLDANLIFGVTSCDPSDIQPYELPSDPDDLMDRQEYWVVRRESKMCNIGDILVYTISNAGALKFSRNGEPLSTIAHIDNSVPLWFFIDIYAYKCELLLAGVYEKPPGNESLPSCIMNLQNSPTLTVALPPPRDVTDSAPSPSPQTSVEEENAECVICYEERTNSVLYRCGHACMCYDCAKHLWKGQNPHCPVCREKILDVIKIYK